MAYRYGDRRQKTLFPQSIDEYISQDAPVRAYDVFVDALDFGQLSIQIEPDKVGCPQYDPKIMLKLLVYGYSYGIRSSRKLERETHYNLSFIWLSGGLKPDFKTIAEFRRNNKLALTNVLKQCARLCIKLGLIEGNTLFVDGSKIRANASINSSWDENRCTKRLEKIDNRIKEILSECEQADQNESDAASLVKMQEELADNQKLRAKVIDILNSLQAEDRKSINAVDPDCIKIHGRQGSHAGYNAQTVVDEKHGLIVSADVVNENNDLHQFADQIGQAVETLEKKPQTACADSGFSDIDELEKVDNEGIKVVVPSMRQAADKETGPFDKSNFKYDHESDSYTCPTGKILKYRRTETDRDRKEYRPDGGVCQACPNFGVCTKGRNGRKVTRMLKEELCQKLERQYEQPDSQEIYKLRKQKVELPFGHIKHNLKVGGFLLRGLAGVKAEMSILSSCFNIARMINLIGVSGLIARLGC
ncbi:MAG: IS1182 family transposase [Phycisphaerae bacterium]|jgi:transposase